ncbi:hypothetical protein DITRI_Ditri05aG0114700 [Diplodiscus trichospermus]
MMSEKIGAVIGESTSDVEDMDIADSSSAWGKSLRVHVHLNITKPLKQDKKLSISKGDKIMVVFLYERLPDFCYVCGKLDYKKTEYN